jgi:hypothetical protein
MVISGIPQARRVFRALQDSVRTINASSFSPPPISDISTEAVELSSTLDFAHDDDDDDGVSADADNDSSSRDSTSS